MKELKQATETSINHLINDLAMNMVINHLINDLAMNMIGTSNK